MTAIGVAVIRARESRRADRLYDDPLAQVLVEAARGGFTGERWARLEALAETFQEGRSAGVRLVDDRIRAAVDRGIRQIVLIGAGLDTRAYRMDFPEGTRLFEIDLPETFSFKEPVLAGAVPRCERHVVPVDLRTDWVTPLLAEGFRPEQPTQWVDEGVLGYLSPEEALAVAADITELSAPGSDFGVGRFAVDANNGQYAELRRMVSGDEAPPRAPGGLGPDAAAWLEAHGWETEFHSWDELVASFGRPLAVDDPAVGVLVAVRR
ncbi:SAM-dependent methyltransferase [Nocardia sp. NPDC050406]|uniref:SAM-dependent methyltransferase n=1 Tax=Nocardia sp. NPDC050406 TaxID=3364318 RepID=UPI00378D149C